MEAGLWSLYFATIIGMTTMAVRSPALYQRLAVYIGVTALIMGIAVAAYLVVVTQVYSALLPFIDPTKLAAASKAKDGWLPSMWAILALMVLWCYSAVCHHLSNYVSNQAGK